MKIYYAHHIWKYNTEIEKYEIDLIHKHFGNATIVNPNGMIDQSLSEEEIIDTCLGIVRECDITVFSSVGGVIGHGVYQEVNEAINNGKPVYYIENNKLAKKGMLWCSIITDSNSKRIYAKLK